MQNFKIAAVQRSPVFLDRDATIEKACAAIDEAASNGAQLVLFPEAFVPAYPDWLWSVPPSNGQMLAELYAELMDQAVTIPDEATARLGQAARKAGVYVAIGVNERNSEASNASLYNTLLYLDPAGNVMGKHRKLVPTAAERLVWAPGDGSTLGVYDTPLGKLGGLICWENYMPLARYALYAWGIQIYLAPTWDRGDEWLATLRHIAREGRMVVVGCCMALRKGDIPDRYAFKKNYEGGEDTWINSGDSAIVDAEGRVVAGPLHCEEGILYADVSAQQARGAKWMFDAAGHYGRPDVFQLKVNREVRSMVVAQGAVASPTTPVDGPEQNANGAPGAAVVGSGS